MIPATIPKVKPLTRFRTDQERIANRKDHSVWGFKPAASSTAGSLYAATMTDITSENRTVCNAYGNRKSGTERTQLAPCDTVHGAMEI